MITLRQSDFVDEIKNKSYKILNDSVIKFELKSHYLLIFYGLLGSICAYKTWQYVVYEKYNYSKVLIVDSTKKEIYKFIIKGKSERDSNNICFIYFDNKSYNYITSLKYEFKY